MIRMITIQVILGLTLHVKLAIGQQDRMNDLDSIIRVTQNDSLKAASYYELAFLNRQFDLERAKSYSDSGFLYFNKLQDDAGIHLKYYLDGALAHAEGNYEEAIDQTHKHYDWAIQTNNLLRQSYAVSSLAKFHREKGDLTKAVEFTIRGIELQDSMGRSEENGFYYAELGDLYTSMKQWDKAREYIIKSIELARQTNFTIGEAFSLRNLASNLIEGMQYDSAEVCIQQATILDSVNGYNVGLASNHRYLGLLYEKKGEPELASQYYEKAASYLTETDNPYDLAKIYQSQGRVALSQKKYQRASGYLRLADNYGNSITASEFQAEQALLQSELNAQQGNFRQAYFLAKKHRELDRDLLDQNIANQIAGLNIQYETDQKEQEIELLNSQNQITALQLSTSRRTNLALALGIVAFALILFFVFSLYRKIRQQNQTITRALDEKDILLREIHHRVKNNLQVISSLLSLQSRSSDDPQIEAAIQDSRNRVKSMSLIHQNLYQRENLTSIFIGEYFEQLITNLFNSYNIHPDRIKLETDIQAIQLDVDTAIPLGLIVNELISNALKYAFPNNKKGLIEVSLKEIDEQLVLTVADDGIGMPLNAEQKQNFGYKLINVFSNKMKADLNLDADEGTTVRLAISDYKKVA